METLIILHGAVGAKDQFKKLADTLSSKYKIILHDFPGHGERVNEHLDFTIDNFVEDLDQLVSKHSDPIIFAYSMGGYVAIMHAAKYPGKIKSIFTLGSKVDWNPDIAKKESAMFNPEKIEEKVPKFATILNQRHKGQWKDVLTKTRDLMDDLGQENSIQTLQKHDLNCSINMLLADQDEMVSKEETDALALKIGAKRFDIPNSKHPIEKVDLDELVKYF